MAWVRKFGFINQQYSKVLGNHIRICSPCPKGSRSLPQLTTSLITRRLRSHKVKQNDLNGHKTALNTTNPPYHASFDLNKRLTSFLCEVIDQQVDFLPVFNKEQECACIHARIVGKLMVKKSTKQPHLVPFLLQNINRTLNKPP